MAECFHPQKPDPSDSPKSIDKAPELSCDPIELASQIAREKTRAAFDLLDLDNDGELTRDEFTRFIGFNLLTLLFLFAQRGR